MTYRYLFSSFAIIRQLAFVQFFAYFGTLFSNVAIYSSLVFYGASSVVISWVMAMYFLPAVLTAPFSGAMLDRFSLKKLMSILLLIEISMTLMFLSINSIEDIWLLMVLIFVRSASSSMFFSSQMSLFPRLISGEALEKANEIHSIIWSFTFAAGMASGGVIVDLYGVKVAYLLDVLFFVIALLAFLKINYEEEVLSHKEKVWKLIKDGYVYIKSNTIIFKLMLLHASVGLLSFDTIITLLADFEYKKVVAVPIAIGMTGAIKAIAFMIGPFVLSVFKKSDRLFWLLLFQGVFIIFWAIVQKDFYNALFGVFLSGILTTTIWSYTYALLQQKIEHRYLGRVLSYNEMIFMFSNMTTALFVGFMAKFIDISFITAFLGVLFFIVALFYRSIKKEI